MKRGSLIMTQEMGTAHAVRNYLSHTRILVMKVGICILLSKEIFQKNMPKRLKNKEVRLCFAIGFVQRTQNAQLSAMI